MSVKPGDRALPEQRLPSSRGYRLARPDLVQRIDSSAEPLLLMVAPSGYGKTNLLGEWGAATSATVAWVSCEPADQDPSHFAARLAARIEARWPGAGNDASLTISRTSWTHEGLAAALSRDLGDLPGANAIAIDDSQLAASSAPLLATLSHQLPTNMRMLIASQQGPAFSTARMRIEGRLAEIRASDIAFSAGQTAQLLARAGIDLTADDARRLHGLTEGWPAGLQMAILAMRKVPDPRLILDAFEATTRDASDYLANEVIAGLSVEMTEFITTISVLDEFDADLCEELTGRVDAGALLRQIVEDDLFIYQLDVAGERFRFHQMFAAYLRSRLKAQGREAFRRAHRQATESLLRRADRLGALRHAMLAEDLSRAVSIVGESVAKVLEVDDARQALEVARAWLGRLGDGAVADDPDLFLEVVLVLASCGQGDTERWLVSFDQLHPDPAARLAALAHGTWAAFYNNRGSSDLALLHNAKAVSAATLAAGEGPMFPKLAELRLQEVCAHVLLGDLLAASEALDRPALPISRTIVEDVGEPAIRQFVGYLRGDLASVHELTEKVRRGTAEHEATAHSAGPIAGAIARAGVHTERGEHDAAAALLATAQLNAEINGRPLIQSFVARAQAQLLTGDGDLNGAKAAIAHARLVFAAPVEAVAAQLAIEDLRISVELTPEKTDEARLRLLPDSAAVELLRARLALSRAQWSSARETLDRVKPHTVRETIERHLLSALANQNSDLAASHEHLQTALQLAQPHGYRMTITRSGPGMAALLRSMPTTPGIADYVEELLHASYTKHSTATSAAGPPATTVLTARELEILRLLSTRLTTGEIAATLFVSINTLKTHLRSIYQKLLVNSRTDAVAQGHARALI